MAYLLRAQTRHQRLSRAKKNSARCLFFEPFLWQIIKTEGAWGFGTYKWNWTHRGDGFSFGKKFPLVGNWSLPLPCNATPPPAPSLSLENVADKYLLRDSCVDAVGVKGGPRLSWGIVAGACLQAACEQHPPPLRLACRGAECLTPKDGRGIAFAVAVVDGVDQNDERLVPAQH
jgi:hypothetical protein